MPYSNRLRLLFLIMCVLLIAGTGLTGYYGYDAYLHRDRPANLWLAAGIWMLGLGFLCLHNISDEDAR